MKTVKYKVFTEHNKRHVLIEKKENETQEGIVKEVEIEYDERGSCRVCGLSVVSASVGGTDVCPWCDCGKYRDGSSQMFEYSNPNRLKRKAKEIDERMENKTKILQICYPLQLKTFYEQKME